MRSLYDGKGAAYAAPLAKLGVVTCVLALPVEDVIEEAMEEVLLQRGEIKHIATDNPRLEEISHIGAFLRYKI